MVEKISKYTLWAGMGISILILVLFFLIQYDRPFEENPKFTDPLLTDALLIWTYFLTAVAVIVTVWSLIHGATTKGTGTMKETGLIARTGSIAWGICIASLILGAIIGFACKDDTMLINGKDWNNPFDIILTDMSLISIIVLLICTIIATAFSMISKK
jgi:hypothetical protein